MLWLSKNLEFILQSEIELSLSWITQINNKCNRVIYNNLYAIQM